MIKNELLQRMITRTSVVEFDVEGQLGGHGQQVLLQSVLHNPLLLLHHHHILLLRRLPPLQLLSELLQSRRLDGRGCLSLGRHDCCVVAAVRHGETPPAGQAAGHHGLLWREEEQEGYIL